MYESKQPYFYGTGRRKHSVARVRVYEGTGKITINGRDIDDYFGLETLKLIVRQPFAVTDTMDKYDIVCTVTGGGVTGQAGAIRHGLSRALLQASDEFRPLLKKEGFLTRDPRMKERKKYGLKAARRAPQFSKRYLKTCVFTHFASGQILFGQHLVNSKPLCSRREVFLFTFMQGTVRSARQFGLLFYAEHQRRCQQLRSHHSDQDAQTRLSGRYRCLRAL